MSIISKTPLVKKIVEGSANEELIDMLIRKQLPFTEEEYLESLVFVLSNEKVKVKALDLLKGISENVKASYADKLEADHRVAYFVVLEALNLKSLSVISKAIRNQSLPYEFLLKIGRHGDVPMLEALLDNQIKLIAYPEILDEIEKNPEATNFIKGKIKEIRAYYLENVEAEPIPEEDVMDDVKEIMTKELEQKAAAETEEGEDDDLLGLEGMEEKALTTLQEINAMNISDRIKLALTGSKTQRMILIKDSNKMVSMGVLESPKIGIDEVSLLVKNKSIAGEIIGRIARRRDWTKNYAVMIELVRNPKTPVKDALGFVKKLHIRDLQLLSRDKNVGPVIRQLAVNYFKQKSGIKK